MEWTESIARNSLDKSGSSCVCMIEECPWFSATQQPTLADMERYQNQLLEAEKGQILGLVPVVLLCLYDKTAFPSYTILGAEHVHSTVISS